MVKDRDMHNLNYKDISIMIKKGIGMNIYYQVVIV